MGIAIGLCLLMLISGCDKKHPVLTKSTPLTSQTKVVILAMGQSNMTGAGMGNEFPEVEGVITDTPRRGPAYVVASILRPQYAQVRLLNRSVNSTTISYWVGHYSEAANEAKAFTDQGEQLVAVLFDQGEEDAMEVVPSPWAQSFTQIVNGLRSILGPVPVVYAQIGPHGNISAPNWETIQQQQASVSLAGVTMVKTDGLAMSDNVHYSSSGYEELGRRMAMEVRG
jgi:hypothetical protein